MRRNVRKRNNQDDELNSKIIKYSGIGIAILAIIVFVLLIYSKNLNNKVKDETLTSEQISSILSNTTSSIEDTESASVEIGKSVNEVRENNIVNNSEKSETKTNTTSTSNEKILSTNKIIATNTVKENNITSNSKDLKKEEDDKSTTTVELNFEKPVDGEIIREFAEDNLIYSNTLQEWTTHTGIDIKADKTTVVKASEEGIVKTIKNDPRYGLSIIVEHANGFKTVYSNLLTSEFVVEGEKVQKGQSLGTVGSTAAFEVADDTHLHFEILKDSVQVDPNIYLK